MSAPAKGRNIMEIRNMRAEDYDDVYSLWTRTAGMGLNPLDDTREGIGKFLARNPGTCFVATIEGRIVGAILSGHDGRRGFIYHAAVAAGERLKGIGKALVAKATEALGKEGIRKVALLVMKENDIGNRFWEAEGFGVREDLVYRNKVIAADTTDGAAR